MVMGIVGDALIGIVAGGLVLAGILVILIWIKNLTKKISYLRLFVQIVSLIAIALSLTILATWPSLVVGVIILVTIFFGRFFCGWICPLGLYMDLVTLFRKVIKRGYWNLSEKANRYLHKLRYVIVAAVLTLPFFMGKPVDAKNWNSFLLFQEPFKPLIIFFLGPLEPLLIPWEGAIGFNGWSLSFPYIRGIMDYFPEQIVTISVLTFIVFVLLSSFTVRRFWCRFCPTGVSIAAIDRFKRSKWMPMLHINKEEKKCTKCGICKRVCPVQVTDVYEEKGGELTTSMCMLCLRCVEMCPYENCLKVNMAGKTVFKSRNWLEQSTIE
jgi:ferredoxin-type protein NapH